MKILFFYNNSFIFAKSRTKTQNIAQKNARKGIALHCISWYNIGQLVKK